MIAFRILLLLIFTTITLYTLPVLMSQGFTLFQVFFGDIAEMAWPGQFNLDFMGMLLLSGFWLAWRHQFSPAGLALGLLGFLGGAPVLTAYLFITSFNVEGDVGRLLLGDSRALK